MPYPHQPKNPALRDLLAVAARISAADAVAASAALELFRWWQRTEGAALPQDDPDAAYVRELLLEADLFSPARVAAGLRDVREGRLTPPDEIVRRTGPGESP